MQITFGRAAVSLIALSTLFAAGGCADVIATSSDARAAGIKQYGDGQYVDAAGSFRNATKTDPRDYKSYYWLGCSYDAAKSYHQAMQSYRAGLDVMTVTIEGRADKYFRQRILDALAISIAKGGDLSFASETSDSSGKLTLPEQKLVMAKVYRYLDDPDSALSYYKQAALLDAKDFFILREYGLYLESLRQNEMATVALRRAYALNDKDKDVRAALVRLGTVPGPSLKDKKDLVNTPVPQGPIPEVNMAKLRALLPGSGSSSGGGYTSDSAIPPAEPAGSRQEPTENVPATPPKD